MKSDALLAQLDQSKLKPARLREQRASVTRQLLKRSEVLKAEAFKHIETRDLAILFDVVDREYFDGNCTQVINDLDATLSFRLSKRMTSCGGTTTLEYESNPQQSGETKKFEIAVATTLLFDTFRLRKSAKVGGVNCHNSLEALTRIMEHEMVHLIELLLWDDSNCSGKRFQQISWRRFGHLEPNHQLLTPADVAKASYGIRAGDQVTFRFDGKQHIGWVNRITKRATVLVNNEKGTPYSDGQRYLKYYVPVSQLRKLR